jgi:hypothetical protein
MQRIIVWLASVIIVTLIFGSIYVTLQQFGRRAVNAAPAAAAAVRVQQPGSGPTAVPPLELTADSGVFVMVFGTDNKPTSSTVALHGELPVIPAGVLETARSLGSDTVTWQPEPGLRMAVVARQAPGGVVVAGQSLTPFEDSDRMSQLFLGAGWLGSMVVLAAAYGSMALIRRRQDIVHSAVLKEGPHEQDPA